MRRGRRAHWVGGQEQTAAAERIRPTTCGERTGLRHQQGERLARGRFAEDWREVTQGLVLVFPAGRRRPV